MATTAAPSIPTIPAETIPPSAEPNGVPELNGGDDKEEWLVRCRCESAKPLAALLGCLPKIIDSDARLQPVTVFCSPSALTFHILSSAKQTQASVDINVGLFTDYQLATGGGDGGEDWQAGGAFCVNLTTVLECLSVLGTHNLEHTKLSLAYHAQQELLRMELLDESGLLSTITIPGMVAEEEDLSNSLALAFRSSPIAARFIVKSSLLKHVVGELELVSGADHGTVSLGPQGLEIAAVGHWGECVVSIPAKGDHVVVPVDVKKITAPRNYPMHALLGSMRGLDLAEETCITINDQGMMAIQHQVLERQVGDGSPHFVDVIMVALKEDEEDGEDPSRSGQVPSQHVSPSQSRGSVASRTYLSATDRSSRYTADGDDEDDDEESHVLSSSAAPLFGSLVDDSTTTTSPRRKRRVTSSQRRRVASAEESESSESENASVNLLASSEDEDMEETEPLDVTAGVSRRRDRDRSSSPELVYGRQH